MTSISCDIGFRRGGGGVPEMMKPGEALPASLSPIKPASNKLFTGACGGFPFLARLRSGVVNMLSAVLPPVPIGID